LLPVWTVAVVVAAATSFAELAASIAAPAALPATDTVVLTTALVMEMAALAADAATLTTAHPPSTRLAAAAVNATSTRECNNTVFGIFMAGIVPQTQPAWAANTMTRDE
jgi:hypothetical protein